MSDSRGVKRKRVGDSSYVESKCDFDPDIESSSLSIQEAPKYTADLQFYIDIICNDETGRRFIQTYDKTYSDSAISVSDEYDFNKLIRKVVLEQLYSKLVEVQAPNPDGEIDMDSSIVRSYPKCGNRVSVSYTPASQRYIEHYAAQAFQGDVFFSDPDNDNFFMWNVEIGPIIENKISLIYRVQSYRREGCHFLGMSDCYFRDYRFT